MSGLFIALLLQLPTPLDQAAALEAQGEDDAALRTVEGAAIAEPTSELYRLEAARLLLKLGREPERAQTHLEIALALAPENPRGHFLWAALLEERRDLRGALQSLEHALLIRPSDLDARARAASMALSLGDDLRAEYHLRELKKLHPELTGERIQLALLLERQGRLEDAEAEFQALLAEFPQNAGVRRRYADFLERRGRAPEAAAIREEPQGGAQKKMRPLKKSRR